ncbi:flagellar protein export ATPase FliI [Marinagarivorans cellulosilyticus]|uniref:Flagellum-specific ATP synthase n=1 Tax=Marinagarivorans cellulosilyticus TaxID=2721545 RepID=A0AAN2BLP9_9GAMM|nr:flagellar protein export ATPase FliI [Marinagarivorans cellulosilyticus]BCD99241.1 flagellum-specific ATP synthase [Marinagarivorans cellulosilyticus]
MIDLPISASERLAGKRQYASFERLPLAAGRLTRMVGLTLEAVGLSVPVGTYCEIIRPGRSPVEAEIVGFSDSTTYLMPIRAAEGLKPGLVVKPVNGADRIRIGEASLGRIINGLGHPLDGKGPLEGDATLDIKPQTINPMDREPVVTPLDVGIRAINALLTVGEGQRLGLFAGSGVGKSVLLGMMTKFTEADVVVVGLIGERGREVKEFIEHILGEEGLKRSVVVAAPADEAPLMRLRASYLATRIAEHFRDEGKKVLLLMDSLTRFAQAQREISLAIGEPPATKGYPPSVFARLPELVERAGNGAKGQGSVTAFYTVLTEGDDLQDPIADSARAILDGHIVLSRQLAEEGVYPAINIEASISRVMPNIVPPEQLKMMQNFKQLLAAHRQNKDLISVGAYVPGADATIDRAIERHPHLIQFISQGLTQKAQYAESAAHLKNVIAGPVQAKS